MKSPLKALAKLNRTSSLQLHQIFRFGCFFFTSILLSQKATLHDIGQYEVMMFLSAMFSYFWINGILNSFLTTRFSEYSIFKAFNLLLLFNFCFTGLTIIILKTWPTLFSIESGYRYLFITYFFFNNLSFFIEYLFLYRNKPRNLFLYSITSSGIYIAGVCFIIIILPFYLVNLFYFLVLIVLLKAILLATLLFKERFSTTVSYDHLRSSGSLSLSFLTGGAGEYTDGIILNRMFNPGIFAIYQYGAREFPLFLLMANALSNSVLPDFNEIEFSEVIRKLKTQSNKLMNYFFPVAAVLMFTAPLLFPVIFSPLFSKSANIFNIYLLLLIPRMLFPQTILMGLKQFNIILYISFAEILVNLVCSISLAFYFGFAGVAWGTLIAFLFEKVALAIILQKYNGVKVRDYIRLNKFLLLSSLLVFEFLLIILWKK